MQIVTVVQRKTQTAQPVLKYTKLPAVNLAILCPVAVVSKTVLQQKMLQDVAMAHMIAMMDAVAQENVVKQNRNVLIMDIMEGEEKGTLFLAHPNLDFDLMHYLNNEY